MDRKIVIFLMCSLLATTLSSAAGDSSWLGRFRGEFSPKISSSNFNMPSSNIKNATRGKLVAPELDLSYFVTPNIAFELAVSTARTKVIGNKSGNMGVDVGKVSILPVSLMAQYHFLPIKAINPYVGVGVNYSHFYDAKKGLTIAWIDYENFYSPVLQAGADFNLNEKWSVNLDVKKGFVRSRVISLSTSGTYMNQHIKIEPWFLGLGIGYRFC